MDRRQRLAEASYDEVHPTFKLIAERLPRDLAKAMRDDPSIMDTMVRAGRTRQELAFNRYMRLDEQRDFWSVKNHEMGWGLDTGSLQRAAAEARNAKWEDPSLTFVIVPRFPPHEGTTGVKHTFSILWELAKRNMAASDLDYEYRDADIRTRRDALASNPPSGQDHRPGFSLEVIRWTMVAGEYGSRHSVGEVVNRDNLPVEAGGLACAVVHPEWLRQFKCIEPVYLSGYAVSGPNLSEDDCVPSLAYYGGDEDRIKLALRRRAVLTRSGNQE